MATLKQVRARIKTSEGIQQITRAMKMVAAARLRRAQDRVIAARPYADKMLELMGKLGAAGDLPDHPLLVKRPVQRAGVLLMTSDRGLCGSFNSNIIRFAEEALKKQEKDHWRMVTCGKKGQGYFGRRKYEMSGHYSFATSGATIDDAIQVTNQVRELFESGEVDAIYLVYSKFMSAMRQVPVWTQILPIEPPAASAGDAPSQSRTAAYEFEPNSTELLGKLLPRYLLTQVYQAILESTASEHGSRMTAMTSATDNAGKMIRELKLHANKVRQAAITKEILEVVGGANALSG